MKKNYFFSAALLFGAAAMLSPVQANAKGGWRNMNHLLQNVSMAPGWNGMITGAELGIGEMFPGACKVYQVVRDLPAGEYTLSANAFYRVASAPTAANLHFEGKDANLGFIFINDIEAATPSLFDKEGVSKDKLFNSEGYVWGVVPNGLGEAFDAFAAGNYKCSVTATHPGGDMVIGFKYLGYNDGQLVMGDHTDQWAAFSNFELKDASGNKIALAADGKFTKVGNDDGWDIRNITLGTKGRGLQNGGVFSKTNASPFNHSQTLENLPAGKYRFCVQSFNQHFLGAHSGYFVPMKGAFVCIEGKSAYDMYKENAPLYQQGQVDGNKADSNYDVKDPVLPVGRLEAYVYINEGEKQNIGEDFLKHGINQDIYDLWLQPWDDEEGHHEINGTQVKIKNLFDENLDEYPEVQNYKMANGDWKWVNGDGTPGWFESGHMREIAAFFVAHPELFQNSAEIELKGESNTLTVGVNKDINQNNYATPTYDFRLEYFDPEYEGYDVTGVESVTLGTIAPVEYYNLQGVRVANPENGVYIQRQGGKTVKVIR